MYNGNGSGGHTDAIREKYSKTTRMQIGEPGDIVDFAVNNDPLKKNSKECVGWLNM